MGEDHSQPVQEMEPASGRQHNTCAAGPDGGPHQFGRAASNTIVMAGKGVERLKQRRETLVNGLEAYRRAWNPQVGHYFYAAACWFLSIWQHCMIDNNTVLQE
jgi:hypothetical protein